MNGGTMHNGVWLPNNADLGAVVNAEVEREAVRIADYCRKWPKGEQKKPNGAIIPAEPPLKGGDVSDIVLVHAKIQLWNREFAEAVGHRTMQLLGLIRPKPVLAPQPDNRQNRRAQGRAGRGALRTVPERDDADDPQGTAERTGWDQRVAERAAESGKPDEPGTPPRTR